MSNWYLVYAKARQEEMAAAGLEEQGYAVYLPKLKVRRRRRGRDAELLQPLFPRYLFAAPGRNGQPIGPVQYTRGVQKLVRFGTVYLPVPDTIVNALKRREDPETGVHHLRSRRIEPGTRVRITSGAFAGIEAIFEARTARDRVTVLLELLGQPTRTEVPVEALEW